MPTEIKEGLRGVAESTFSGYRLDPKKIEVQKGFNARNFDLPENQEHVKNLAASIAAVGVQVPLVVRYDKGKVILVDGESRLKATLKAIKDGAEVKSVPVVQEDKHLSDEERVASLLSRNSGKPLTFIERGEVFARLKAFGWSDADIAKKTGITQAHVSNIMLIHKAPASVKQMINKGTVSASLAAQMIRDHGDEAAKVLKEAASDGKVTMKKVAHVKPKVHKVKRDPLAFGRTEAKQFFAGLCDIYFNVGTEELSPKQVQGICRNVFEDTLGSDWKVIAKEFHDEQNRE